MLTGENPLRGENRSAKPNPAPKPKPKPSPKPKPKPKALTLTRTRTRTRTLNRSRARARRESEYLTKHKDPELPSYIRADAKDISLALLAKVRVRVRVRVRVGVRGPPILALVLTLSRTWPSASRAAVGALRRSRSTTSSRRLTGISSWPWS